jgi:hypothetical protein
MSIDLNLSQLAYMDKSGDISLEELKVRFDHISSDISSINFSDSLTVSQEGFISNIFVGLIDTIFGIFSNITNQFAILSKVKESELRIYANKNALRLRSIFNLPYTSVSMVKIPSLPFASKYLELIIFLNSNYEKLNIVNTYPKLINNFKEVSTLLVNKYYKESLSSIEITY